MSPPREFQENRETVSSGGIIELPKLKAKELHKLHLHSGKSYTYFGRHYPCMLFIAQNSELFGDNIKTLDLGVGFSAPSILDPRFNVEPRSNRPMSYEPVELVAALNQTGKPYSLAIWEINPAVIEALKGQSKILVENVSQITNIAEMVEGEDPWKVSPGLLDYPAFFLKGLGDPKTRSIPIRNADQITLVVRNLGDDIRLPEIFDIARLEPGIDASPQAQIVLLPKDTRRIINNGIIQRDALGDNPETDFNLVVAFNVPGGIKELNREEAEKVSRLLRPGGIILSNPKQFEHLVEVGKLKKIQEWPDVEAAALKKM